MNKDEILQEIKEITRLYKQGRAGKNKEKLELGLKKALELRKIIHSLDDDLKAEFEKMYANGFYHLDHGLDAQIYNLMNLLQNFDGILPYLEKSITYLDNKRNADMWRMLGMLYLAQKNDLEKACEAWKKAIEINPSYTKWYSGLNVVFVHDAMKKQGENITWKIEHLDLKTGEFSIILNKN